MKGPARSLVLYGALGVAAALLILIAVQQDALEGRLIEQTKATAALRESTERISQQLDRIQKEGVVSSGTAATSAEYVDPQAKILHPEVPNFLAQKQVRWPDPKAKLDGVLKRGWASGDPKTLNGIIANASEVQELVTHYVDASAAQRNNFTDPDTWYGDLAWRVEVTNDSKDFTVYLRRGVKWHVPSGVDLNNPKYAWLKGDHELTAHDFAFTVGLIVNPQVENGSLKNYYSDLASWEALDDYTFVMRWKRRVFHGAEYVLYFLNPLPRFIFEHNEDGSKIPKETLGTRLNNHWYNNKGYVGVGPYRMARYEPGNGITLERNESYYGDKPAIKTIIYPIYTDTNQTVLKLKAKELSVGFLVPSQYRREILDFQKLPKDQQPKDNPFLNGTLTCQIIDLPSFRYIGWNSLRARFSDVRVRKAMTFALNREAIIRDVFVGLGKVARGPFLEGSSDLDPSIEPLPFDLQQATQLLEEAGWKDSNQDGLRDKVVDGRSQAMEFSLLIYAGSAEFSALANIFKEDLLKIGVKLNIEAAEWSLMQNRMHEKDFDAFVGGWSLDWSSDPYQLFHSSQADAAEGSNMTSFKNAEADRLMEKLRETIDPKERQTMLHRMHRLIFDSFNYTFLSTERRPFCHHKEVKGIRFSKVRPIPDARPWWVEAN
jgi:ABC-type transport system substrate-binding protein